MYCEGGRSRTGGIGDTARPGIGRLALESGALIVPVAVHGSSRVRNWRRLQFPTVTVQYGEPFRYERIEEPTRDQQQAVADAIFDEIRDALRRARGGGPRGRARAGARRAARAARQADRRGVAAYSPGARGHHARRAPRPRPGHRRARRRSRQRRRRAGDAGQARRLRAPVYVTAPLGDTEPGVRRRAGRARSGARGRGAASTFLDLTGDRRLAGQRARPALDRLRARLRHERPVLRLLHGAGPTRPDHASKSTASTPRTRTRRTRPTRGRWSTIPHDQQANHNGGQLQFGPDGLLYAGTGDGGSGGDPSGNAPEHGGGPARRVVDGVNHDYRLGKLLRIDPRHRRRLDLRLRPAQPVALLLRPQHRRPHHRRRGPGPLRGGRLRRGARRRRAAPTTAGTSYEGLHTYPGNGPRAPRRGRSCPVIEYPHSPACSITGGYVVRDPPCPSSPAPTSTATTARAHLGRHAAGGHDARARPQRGRACRASARTAAGASTPRRSAAPSTASRAAARAPGRRRSSAGCPPASRRPARGPTAARRPSPCCAPPRASTRCAPASSRIRVRCDELCTVSASGRVLITRRAHAAAARGPAHAHRAGDAGGRRAHDAAPEALEGHAPRDQALAGPARPARDGAHHGARRGPAGNARTRDAARAHRALSQRTSAPPLVPHDARAHRPSLLLATARGDEAAFAALVARHRPRLVRYATSRCGRDVGAGRGRRPGRLVRAHRAIVGGKVPSTSRRGCTPSCATAATTTSAPRSRPPPLPPELPGGAPSAFEVVEQGERLAGALDAVERLPHAQRTALVGRELEGRSYEELARRQATTVLGGQVAAAPRARPLAHQAWLPAFVAPLRRPPGARAPGPDRMRHARRARDRRGGDRDHRAGGHERARLAARARAARGADVAQSQARSWPPARGRAERGARSGAQHLTEHGRLRPRRRVRALRRPRRQRTTPAARAAPARAGDDAAQRAAARSSPLEDGRRPAARPGTRSADADLTAARPRSSR